MDPDRQQGFAPAWVFLALALGVHVADEAAHDFLSVYNPAVLAMRERIGFFPMPTFTFGVWLSGLIVLVLVLLAVSPLALRRSKGLAPIAYFLTVVMFFNGTGHVAGSIYMRDWAPGVYSSPLLMAGSIWLWVSLRRSSRSPADKV